MQTIRCPSGYDQMGRFEITAIYTGLHVPMRGVFRVPYESPELWVSGEAMKDHLPEGLEDVPWNQVICLNDEWLEWAENNPGMEFTFALLVDLYFVFVKAKHIGWGVE